MEHSRILARLREAHTRFLDGDRQGFLTRLDAAQNALAPLPDTPATNRLRGEHALLAALPLIVTPEALPPRLEQAGELMGWRRSAVLPSSVPLSQRYEDPLGLFVRIPGQVDAATEHVARAAALYDRLTGSGMSVVMLLRAQTAYLRGQFVQAELLAHKALYMADGLNQHSIRLTGARLLAHVARYRSDAHGWQAAIDVLDKVAAQAPADDFHTCLATLMRSELMLTQQMTEKLPDWLCQGDFGVRGEPLFGRGFKQSGKTIPSSLYITAFWLHIFFLCQRGEHARCMAAVDVLRETYGVAALTLAPYLDMARGVCLLAQGARDEARGHFAAAVACCAPDGLWLIPAEFARVSDGLMEEVAQAHGEGALRLTALIRGFESAYSQLIKAVRNADTLQDLSPREQTVARLTARGLSNRAVADQLHIAECTVKTHLMHIYSKLGLSSRSQLTAWLKKTSA